MLHYYPSLLLFSCISCWNINVRTLYLSAFSWDLLPLKEHMLRLVAREILFSGAFPLSLARSPAVTAEFRKLGQERCVCCRKLGFGTHLSCSPVFQFWGYRQLASTLDCREAAVLVLKDLFFHPPHLTLLKKTMILFGYLSILFMIRWFMGGESSLRTRDMLIKPGVF